MNSTTNRTMPKVKGNTATRPGVSLSAFNSPLDRKTRLLLDKTNDSAAPRSTPKKTANDSVSARPAVSPLQLYRSVNQAVAKPKQSAMSPFSAISRKLQQPKDVFVDDVDVEAGLPVDDIYGSGNNVEGEDEDEVELGEWIDGKTLVVDEDEDEEMISSKKEEEEKRINLVNSLSEPFEKHLAALKQETIEAMSPALKHAHLVLSHITNHIEPEKLVKDGVVAYESAADEWSASVQEQSDDLTAAVEDSHARIRALVTQLKELEEQREEWWGKMEGLLDEAANAGEEVFADSVASTENTITLVERKVKSVSTGGGVSKKKSKANEMDQLKALMMNM